MKWFFFAERERERERERLKKKVLEKMEAEFSFFGA